MRQPHVVYEALHGVIEQDAKRLSAFVWTKCTLVRMQRGVLLFAIRHHTAALSRPYYFHKLFRPRTTWDVEFRCSLVSIVLIGLRITKDITGGYLLWRFARPSGRQQSEILSHVGLKLKRLPCTVDAFRAFSTSATKEPRMCIRSQATRRRPGNQPWSETCLLRVSGILLKGLSVGKVVE